MTAIEHITSIVGTYLIGTILAIIGYVAKKKYDKYCLDSDVLEKKKQDANEKIISQLESICKSQQVLEKTVSEMLIDFSNVKQSYEQTRGDYKSTQGMIFGYFTHHDKLTIDYNNTKLAVIDIQTHLGLNKLDAKVLPILSDTHLDIVRDYFKHTNVA